MDVLSEEGVRVSAYPEEFRRRAVELARSSGRPVAHVAKELGVDVKALRRWIIEAGSGPTPAFKKDALAGDEKAELVRLRRENRVLAMEVEILKRASAIFARDALPPPK
jgi:transposase-like protein